MKILLTIIAAITIGLYSCSNAREQRSATQAATQMETTQTSTTTPGVKQIIDPVCGMVKDSTWTDYTIANGDTTWFCSEIEKNAYIANPKKYTKRS